MKLYQIDRAKDAWANLANTKKDPKLAYQLAKYIGKTITHNVDLIDNYRNEIIRELGKESESGYGIEPNTPEMAEFLDRIGTYLRTEIDIEPVGISMEELIETLSDNNNLITENDILMLEPFFAE